MSVGKRRFELVEGSSSKFWEVSQEGAAFTVTFGRIGSAGTSKTTTTASPAAAAAEVEKLVREKTKKGYQEAGAAEPAFRPPAHVGTDQHIERFLNYKVVGFNPGADAESGDGARRELPALRELDKLVFAVGVTWDEDEGVFAERLDALFADPRVSELRALVIGKWFGDSCEEPPVAAYERLIQHGKRLDALRGLFLGDVIQEESEISWLHQGDCAPAVHALPKLEELLVRGGNGLRFEQLAHDNLTTLTLQSGGLPKETVRDVVAARLPKLRRLSLWLGDENYGGTTTLDDLAPLLSGKLFPALEHLGLQDSEQADAIAEAVASSPLLARLKGLDLSMGTLSDAGGEALLASPHLRSLKHLNLRHHYMSAELTAKFRGLAIDVNVSDREEADDPDDRYVEVAE